MGPSKIYKINDNKVLSDFSRAGYLWTERENLILTSLSPVHGYLPDSQSGEAIYLFHHRVPQTRELMEELICKGQNIRLPSFIMRGEKW